MYMHATVIRYESLISFWTLPSREALRGLENHSVSLDGFGELGAVGADAVGGALTSPPVRPPIISDSAEDRHRDASVASRELQTAAFSRNSYSSTLQRQNAGTQLLRLRGGFCDSINAS